ncbi:uncharacterized protein FOMMEDRAFT_156884 [Fomitiporia mediterranea MF3/22]|uniref:uncharacterized protein n=1 Tax=Fomitiporia mediterranea (strain MF3/22) TaxID=694068 RepID=UPI00044082BD|nr:uncharacterized protein FOMMEDRAFT_156884 [Fomitiporia mediterranea MF3/22]EJD03474.1 hypothetical protein FOMMEDRAFT_156884 [Fomitiporia mediterranea MF3/22]
MAKKGNAKDMYAHGCVVEPCCRRLSSSTHATSHGGRPVPLQQRRRCWCHWPSASGVAPGAVRARQTKKGIDMPPLTLSRKVNGLEHTEDDHCYIHRTQYSQLICLLEQPVLSLHAVANFDAPAKNMQQTVSTAQHTEWLPTADSQQRRRYKNK